MGKCHRQLQREDRQLLEAYLIDKVSITEIARKLNVTRATIYNEISRGLNSKGVYDAELAQKYYEDNCKKRGKGLKIEKNPELYAYLKSKLINEHMSPENIIEEMKRTGKDKEFKQIICVSTIYAYIQSGLFDG